MISSESSQSTSQFVGTCSSRCSLYRSSPGFAQVGLMTVSQQWVSSRDGRTEFSFHIWYVCVVTFSCRLSPLVNYLRLWIERICSVNLRWMPSYKVFIFWHCFSFASKNSFTGFINCEYCPFKLLYSHFCCGGCNAPSTVMKHKSHMDDRCSRLRSWSTVDKDWMFRIVNTFWKRESCASVCPETLKTYCKSENTNDINKTGSSSKTIFKKFLCINYIQLIWEVQNQNALQISMN